MSQRPANTPAGFQGSIGSLPLVDLLQVWAMNHLSGLVTVTFESRTGHVYFVEGEIVHAEVAGLTGEPAVRVILGWPEGTFELVPNTATLKRTIHKSLSHLLLDAHRELDEHRREGAAGNPPPLPPSTALQGKEPPKAGVLEQIRAIPGVTRLVRFGKDGRPVGEGDPASEALAAKGLYVAMAHAAAVATAFGLHDLGFATLQGARESFALVHRQGSHLCLEIARGAAMDPIMAQLRALLSRPASR